MKQLANPKLSPVQKAQRGLRMYRDEMVNPTPRPADPYASPVTHDFVLSPITAQLAADGADVAALRKVWETAGSGEVKDCLAIFLALKGDASVKDVVLTYLRNQRNPMRLRERAAMGIGVLALKGEGDPALGKALAQVAREDHQVQPKMLPDPKGKGPARRGIVHPVRRAAIDTIKKLQARGMLLDSSVTAAAEQLPVEVFFPGPGKDTRHPQQSEVR